MDETNVMMDDELIEECMEVTGIRTREALIDFALREVLRHGRQKCLLELKGTVEWEGNLEEWREERL